MSRYSVAIYPPLVVRIDGIEAGSHLEAIQKATDHLSENKRIFARGSSEASGPHADRFAGYPRIRYTELSEEPVTSALVDEAGDPEYLKSKWYVPNPSLIEEAPEYILMNHQTIEQQALVLLQEFLNDQMILEHSSRNEPLSEKTRALLLKSGIMEKEEGLKVEP